MGIMAAMKQARAKAQEHVQFDSRFGNAALVSGKVSYWEKGKPPVKRPVAGATAVFESGTDAGTHISGGRIAVGALLAGPIGAVVGGVLRKNSNRVYVLVEFPDGKAFLVDGPAKDETRAREFAANVQAAGAHYE